MLNCHCRDCQRASGAPFASGIVVRTADLKTSHAPSTYSVSGSSGQATIRSFCGSCGSPLFTRGESNPDFTSIRFPTLDDTSTFRPMLDIWTSRATQWTCFDPGIPQFPQSP
ncbi:GFA family protein [Piscinibacter sakaiensis]|uniref:GFA family protein n=1 Tax=Piscinibacter sakaiensis TaxID=1547922 RepID=UPI003AAF934E